MIKIQKFTTDLPDLLIKKKVQTLWFIAITTLMIVGYSLNKGIIFSDEAFYMLTLIGKSGNPGFTYWNAYASALFSNNILTLRITMFILLIMSAIIFSLGFKRFENDVSLKTILPISLIGLFILSSPVQLVPNYVTFSKLIFLSGIGVYQLALTSKQIRIKLFLATATGVIFSNLLFILITNTPVYSVLFILPFFLLEKRDAIIFNVFLLIGILIGILLFFIFFVPPSQYIENFISTIDQLQFDKAYGAKEIVKWSISTFSYFVREIILSSAIVLVLLQKNRAKPAIYKIISSILFLYIFYIIIYDIRMNHHFNITSPSVIYIFAIGLILHYFYNKDLNLGIIGLFFLSIPFFGSLGTDVKFALRSTAYIMPLLVYVFHHSMKTCKNILIIILLLIIFFFGRFSTEYIFTPGWSGYAISQQTEPLSRLGINNGLKIDKDRYAKIAELKEHIPPHSYILVSTPRLWGYVYLLDLTPALLYFRYNEDYFIYSKDQLPIDMDEIFLLEHTADPFPNKMIIKELYPECDVIQLARNKDVLLYRLYKEKRAPHNL